MSVSDVSRSLQSCVSTNHRSYPQLTFFIFFYKKIKYLPGTKYSCVARQHLPCSFMPACLRCRTVVDTNVLYVLWCSVQGLLKAVLLCLRYVDTAVAFVGWFRAFLVVCTEEETQVQKLKLSGCLCSLEAIRPAELTIQLALTVSLQEGHLPAVMFTSRLVLPGAMTWTE